MEPIKPFFMALYKCKNCGTILSQPHLKLFNVSFNNYKYRGHWCLCDNCIKKLIKKPQYLHFSKSVVEQNAFKNFKKLLNLIIMYKVNNEDIFYE